MLMVAEGKHTGEVMTPARAKNLFFPLFQNLLVP